jgi:hypothetical protein
VLQAHEGAMRDRLHYGAFASRDVPSGTTLGVYAGQVLTARESTNSRQTETAMLSIAPFLFSEVWGEGNDQLLMCVTLHLRPLTFDCIV